MLQITRQGRLPKCFGNWKYVLIRTELFRVFVFLERDKKMV